MFHDARNNVRRLPADANGFRCFKRKPFAGIAPDARLNEYMREFAGLKSNGDKARRMPDAFKQRRKQNALVVTIAGTDTQNGVGGMNRFDAVYIFDVADMIANEFVKRRDFSRPILLRKRAS